MTGAMIIDLQKNALKRAGKKVAAALSWQGWNDTPMGDLHPKGPDGRWVDDHPGVTDLGHMHEHVGSLSNKDLETARGHIRGLTDAILAEQTRRSNVGYSSGRSPLGEHKRTGAPRMIEAERRQSALNRGRTIEEDMANPAKPLRAARKPKVDVDSIRSEWDAAVNRPMPSDRERFRGRLSGLTLKQLEELNGGKLSGSNKEEKIKSLIEHKLGFRLNSEAIRHGHSATGGVLRTDRDKKLERINNAMDEAMARGDRAEYGRLHEERLDLDRGLEREAGGRPASADRPIRQSGTREGGTIPSGVSMTGRGEVTPQSMANARAERTAQARVDKIRERLAAARSKSRDEGLRLQSDDEVRLGNDLRKAEDQLREAKRKAGTLPDSRGNAGPADVALLARGTTPEERAGKRPRGIGPTDEEINRLSEISSRVRGQGGGSESSVAAALLRENLSASELRDMATWVHGSKPPPGVRSKAALQLYLAQSMALQHRRTGNY